VEGAKAAYTTASNLNADHIQTHIKLGRIYADEHNYDEAAKHLSTAYELGMQEPEFMNTYILLLVSNKQNVKAKEMLKVLEDMNPNLPELAKLRELVV
jgi:cytochrome c-type biogenesis protein CcmH/NrfG